MPTQHALRRRPCLPAQTINESVQVWKNRASDSSNCFSSLGRSSAPQSVKSLSEVFSSLVISFTLPVMPTQSAQTINELVQVCKNRASDSSRNDLASLRLGIKRGCLHTLFTTLEKLHSFHTSRHADTAGTNNLWTSARPEERCSCVLPGMT